MEEFPKSQMYERLIRQIGERLQSYSTILVRFFRDGRGIAQAMHIGSGTFISIGDSYGILTAQHVTDTLTGDYALGLAIAPEHAEHRFTIEKSSLRIIEVGTPISEEYGPDLSIIVLADREKIATIKSLKSFHSLSFDREELLTNPPPIGSGIWFACGAPDERTITEHAVPAFGDILSFGHFCGAGGIQREYSRGQFDYFEMDVNEGANADIPQSFSGMSGGGLWQVTLDRAEDKSFVPGRYLLSGVTFYQGVSATHQRFLRFHGRRTIYEHIFDSLK